MEPSSDSAGVSKLIVRTVLFTVTGFVAGALVTFIGMGGPEQAPAPFIGADEAAVASSTPLRGFLVYDPVRKEDGVYHVEGDAHIATDGEAMYLAPISSDYCDTPTRICLPVLIPDADSSLSRIGDFIRRQFTDGYEGASVKNAYYADRDQVFYYELLSSLGGPQQEISPIEGADPKTFERVEGQSRIDARDANHTYLLGQIVD